MDDRGIIIADKDAKYRRQVAEHFKKHGYQVETTDSAVRVLCSILEKQTPVLLLGSDFDKKISSVDLIRLLKKCNRHLHVIMVSDAMPLPLARKVRQEGIFYHALKPAAAGDNEELARAVECAFEKNRSNAGVGNEQACLRPEATFTAGAEEKKSVKWPLKALPWKAFLLIGLAIGVSSLPHMTAEGVVKGNSAAIWIFVGLCGLIIAAQLLPIFRIRVPMGKRCKEAAKQHADYPPER